MSAKWPHTGAVLDGGASSRMGSAKGALPLSTGKTMIETVIQTLEFVCVEVVTVGDSSGLHRFVPDLRADAGPLGGIEALLASGLDDNYLVCPNDTPLITSDLFRLLTAPTKALATIFDTAGGHTQSLPLRVSVAALPTVTAALDEGHNAIHHVLARLEVDRIPISDDQTRGLRNINTPEDFDSIR